MAGFWDGFLGAKGNDEGIDEEKKLEERFAWYSSEKYYLGFLPFGLIIVVVIIISCIANHFSDIELKARFESEFSGTVAIVTKRGGVGSKLYSVSFKYTTSFFLEHTFSGKCFDKNKLVQVGDSVSKPKNSHIMTFFRLKNGIFEKFCECDY